jgi:hypothetical protein
MLSRLTFLKAPERPSAPKDRVITVAGRELSLTIRKDYRARRMTLRIEPGGKGLKLTVPPGLKEREISEFLARHEGWLMTKLAKFPRSTSLEEGRHIPIRGIPHRIALTGKIRGVTQALVIDGENILQVSGAPEHVSRRIRDFLKEEARKELESLARRYAATIGKIVKSVALKDTKSRWGSCSHTGNLSFSWRIVMAPPHVIGYLAAHEVAHLAEMNHSDRFWKVCESLCPEAETARQWLKRNGAMLHIHDFG